MRSVPSTVLLMLLGLMAAAAPAVAQADPPPPARPLWTIASRDCISVHADGEPWDECGFQAFAVNADLSRVLTVSALGLIQVWDGDGRELRRVEWPDDRSGATGYPDGRALIAGHVGVAVTHYNQLLLIDVRDGRILSQTIPDIMSFEELRFVSPDRLFARIKDKDWKGGLREVVLPSGELRKVAGAGEWTRLAGLGTRVWIAGPKAPFTVHAERPDGKAPETVRDCVPVEGRFCFWRDMDGPYVHMLDLARGGGRSLDVGRRLGQWDMVHFAVAGDRPYAVICAKSESAYPSLRPCSVREIESGREIHRFAAGHTLRADGALDELGRPEIRLSLVFDQPPRREQRRVSADGSVRAIDLAGGANPGPPGGGLILAGEGLASILLDRGGRPLASLPFRAQTCGNGWPDWTSYCRFSADGRRWLVPSPSPVPGGSDNLNTGLTLYEIPAAAK